MATPVQRALGSKYELIESVGVGSMGEVWRAWDRLAGRPLAAKLLHPQYARNREVKARFLQEWAVLEDLRHPQIVEVVDLVAEGDELAIVMAWVDGGSLDGYRQRVGTLPSRLAVDLVIPVLDALAFAHGRGVLHRDIKPANVLLAGAAGAAPVPADVRLGDFGIARIAQASMVQATGLLGTLEFMPPELPRSGQFSAASDVYGVGVTLYELLAGRTPFAQPDNPWGALALIQDAAPPRLPVDDRLWQILSITLAKDPGQRLSAAQTARALRDLAPDALSDEALPVQPAPRWALPPTPPARPWSGPVAIHAGAGDPGATQLPGAGLAAAAPWKAATPGPAWRVAGATLPDHTDATLMGAPPPTAVPGLQPQAVPLAARRRVPWWVWLVGAVVLVGLVVGILWWRGVIGPRPPPPPKPTPTVPAGSAHSTGDVAPTGLRVDLDAQTDPTGHSIDVTLTLYAPTQTGLKGTALVVIPADGDCLLVRARASPPPVDPGQLVVQAGDPWTKTTSEDGVSVTCGVVADVEIAAGQSVAHTFTVSGWTADQLPKGVDPWLSSLRQATNEALRQASGTSFPLQRLQGIALAVPDVTLNGPSAEVPYQVFPVWPGQADPTKGDVLFSQDTPSFQALPLLLDVTGGQGLSGGVEVTGCPPATQPGVQQRLTAVQSTPRCEVKIRVGNLTATSSFGIRL